MRPRYSRFVYLFISSFSTIFSFLILFCSLLSISSGYTIHDVFDCYLFHTSLARASTCSALPFHNRDALAGSRRGCPGGKVLGIYFDSFIRWPLNTHWVNRFSLQRGTRMMLLHGNFGYIEGVSILFSLRHSKSVIFLFRNSGSAVTSLLLQNSGSADTLDYYHI